MISTIQNHHLIQIALKYSQTTTIWSSVWLWNCMIAFPSTYMIICKAMVTLWQRSVFNSFQIFRTCWISLQFMKELSSSHSSIIDRLHKNAAPIFSLIPDIFSHKFNCTTNSTINTLLGYNASGKTASTQYPWLPPFFFENLDTSNTTLLFCNEYLLKVNHFILLSSNFNLLSLQSGSTFDYLWDKHGIWWCIANPAVKQPLCILLRVWNQSQPNLLCSNSGMILPFMHLLLFWCGYFVHRLTSLCWQILNSQEWGLAMWLESVILLTLRHTKRSWFFHVILHHTVGLGLYIHWV